MANDSIQKLLVLFVFIATFGENLNIEIVFKLNKCEWMYCIISDLRTQLQAKFIYFWTPGNTYLLLMCGVICE